MAFSVWHAWQIKDLYGTNISRVFQWNNNLKNVEECVGIKFLFNCQLFHVHKKRQGTGKLSTCSPNNLWETRHIAVILADRVNYWKSVFVSCENKSDGKSPRKENIIIFTKLWFELKPALTDEGKCMECGSSATWKNVSVYKHSVIKHNFGGYMSFIFWLTWVLLRMLNFTTVSKRKFHDYSLFFW